MKKKVIKWKYILLANSANTKCRPFQVKIDCSKFIKDCPFQVKTDCCKFIKDRLQSRTDFFIHGETYCLVYFCQGKIAVNIRQVSLNRLNLQKAFPANELLHKWFLRFPGGFFFTYLPIRIFTEPCSCLI